MLDGKKIALSIAYADTIAPAGDAASMGSEDRNCLVILKRWAQNQSFLRADVTLCLVTESLAALNPGLVQNPGVATIEIPLPGEQERAEFVRSQLEATPLPPGSDVTPEVLAKLGAGLKRVQLQNLIAHACENREPLTIPFLTRLKKELIEAESGGLLEFVQSRFDLSMVAGHEPAKKKLRDAAAALRAGRFDVLPMGYVICGPVGTGKTFLTTCFAGEVGIPAVILKNFRSMWQGVTEANLERVLTLLKAMSPIAVVVDEADAQLGNRSSFGDSGVSNRVFAQIAQFMGNTELRGKVIWFLLTCRPDLLPVDLKRQGRAEEHIALFYPHTDEERLAMFRAMQKKTGTSVASEEAEKFFLANARDALRRRHGSRAGPREDEKRDGRRRDRGCRRPEVRHRRFHPAILPDGNRIAKPGGGARMHLEEPAAGRVPRNGPRRGPAARRRTERAKPLAESRRINMKASRRRFTSTVIGGGLASLPLSSSAPPGPASPALKSRYDRLDEHTETTRAEEAVLCRTGHHRIARIASSEQQFPVPGAFP